MKIYKQMDKNFCLFTYFNYIYKFNKKILKYENF